MQTAGRLSAAIAILEDFDRRSTPIKTAIADWSRGARFAGAKDRAWISGLCLDVLRRRNSLAAAMGDKSPRAGALAALRFLWKTPLEELAAIAAETPYGPGPLNEDEREKLGGDSLAAIAAEAAPVAGDFPEWLAPLMARAFGAETAREAQALAARADIDLRINTLKTEPEKALAALRPVHGEAAGLLTTAARIPAPDPSMRAPAVTVIPAFSKGWVEVQDLGSQIAAAAAGDVKGAQALDLCAGGGGKTLALAALMANTGQIYAYDHDARRLRPLYDRAKRAGVRNLQIRNPVAGETLEDLKARMDLVFIDAPCTGSGTWRRHPDSKWRLKPAQLERRIGEQDAVLAEGAEYVKAGGRLIYVTCSVFKEENEDRLDAFLAARPEFGRACALEAVAASGLLTEAGRAVLERCRTPEGALRLTPLRAHCDGFFIAVLKRQQG
ncbi:MAG: MFS transporter [Alphaproteobacteria bacterium]|nr:MFS transporter [Alphaproteobacteria bacterium]